MLEVCKTPLRGLLKPRERVGSLMKVANIYEQGQMKYFFQKI
jgi:hypothetical protein